MSSEPRSQFVNGSLAALRLGTPTVLGIVLYELLELSRKLDHILEL